MEYETKNIHSADLGFRNSATYVFDWIVHKKGILCHRNTISHYLRIGAKRLLAKQQMSVTKRQLAFFVLKGLKRTSCSSELCIII